MSLAEPVTTGQARRPGVLAGGLDATALELRTPQTTGTPRSWACRHHAAGERSISPASVSPG